MRFLLLGAGLQGTAIAHDLLHNCKGCKALTVVDSNAEALRQLRARLDDPRLRTMQQDVRDTEKMAPLMQESGTVISAVNYWFNHTLATLAIDARSHFVDLGGNNDVVEREFGLDNLARRARVTVIPDCGLAPGMAGLLAYHLHSGFDSVESLRLRVGGLPQHPRPPLDYMIVFAVQGLLNEYLEPAIVIRDGQVQKIPSLTELETISFPPPFGELEAFQTSGGTSTLPQTLLGRVRNLDYKTIRYKGHCEKIRLLFDLGLGDAEPLRIRGIELSPRDVLACVLEKSLSGEDRDVALILIEADGVVDGQRLRRSIRIIDAYDEATQMSAMMRTTGYPTAIIARMLAAGEIEQVGARPLELAVPAEPFIAELALRGIELQRSEAPLN